jgi:hypothetical protein
MKRPKEKEKEKETMTEFGNKVLDFLEKEGFNIDNSLIFKEIIFHYNIQSSVEKASKDIVFRLNLKRKESN